MNAVCQIAGVCVVAALGVLPLYMVWWGYRDLRRDRSHWWRAVVMWLLAWYFLAAFIGLALPRLHRGY